MSGAGYGDTVLLVSVMDEVIDLLTRRRASGNSYRGDKLVAPDTVYWAFLVDDWAETRGYRQM